MNTKCSPPSIYPVSSDNRSFLANFVLLFLEAIKRTSANPENGAIRCVIVYVLLYILSSRSIFNGWSRDNFRFDSISQEVNFNVAFQMLAYVNLKQNFLLRYQILNIH